MVAEKKALPWKCLTRTPRLGVLQFHAALSLNLYCIFKLNEVQRTSDRKSYIIGYRNMVIFQVISALLVIVVTLDVGISSQPNQCSNSDDKTEFICIH